MPAVKAARPFAHQDRTNAVYVLIPCRKVLDQRSVHNRRRVNRPCGARHLRRARRGHEAALNDVLDHRLAHVVPPPPSH
jgi:hypothetical protein